MRPQYGPTCTHEPENTLISNACDVSVAADVPVRHQRRTKADGEGIGGDWCAVGEGEGKE